MSTQLSQEVIVNPILILKYKVVRTLTKTEAIRLGFSLSKRKVKTPILNRCEAVACILNLLSPWSKRLQISQNLFFRSKSMLTRCHRQSIYQKDSFLKWFFQEFSKEIKIEIKSLQRRSNSISLIIEKWQMIIYHERTSFAWNNHDHWCMNLMT